MFEVCFLYYDGLDPYHHPLIFLCNHITRGLNFPLPVKASFILNYDLTFTWTLGNNLFSKKVKFTGTKVKISIYFCRMQFNP